MFIRRFSITSKTTIFKFNDVNGDEAPTVWLKNALDEVFSKVTGGFDPADRVRMVLKNSNFPDKPLRFLFRRADQLNSTLETVLQSNVSFFSNDALRLRVGSVALPVGHEKPIAYKLQKISDTLQTVLHKLINRS
ncbi:hypothetical protein FQA39_LY07514 [Lamprigera yunnana]|nr:hypothetical protein FQA39_LY07514 [Lamprigera yunnana]